MLSKSSFELGAVLFDLDDTLITSNSIVPSAWRDVCKEIAPDMMIEPDQLWLTVMKMRNRFWSSEAKATYGRAHPRDAREAIVRETLTSLGLGCEWCGTLVDRYEVVRDASMSVVPAALETLQALRTSGVRLALVTNGPSSTQRAKLSRFHLEERFDQILIEGEYGVGKPQIECFLSPLSSFGVRPESAWMVGDDPYMDIAGAQNAGLNTLWIRPPEAVDHEPGPASALVAESMAEVFRILTGENLD